MKRAASLVFIACAALAHAEPALQEKPADPLHALPAGEPLFFDERVRLAKEAESDERYKDYTHGMFQRTRRKLARTMRSCIARSPKPDAKMFVLVADINSKGKAGAVAVKPENAVAQCFAAGFSSISFPKPPEYAGREGFPVTMRVSVRP